MSNCKKCCEGTCKAPKAPEPKMDKDMDKAYIAVGALISITVGLLIVLWFGALK